MKKVAILLFITSSFVFAQNTYVPDDKFEQALIDLGYDTTLDDYVLTANISGVTSLNVGEKEISDLTGIEAFVALEELWCYQNKLTSLDLSKNTALYYLNSSINQLTSLDVTKNTALKYLYNDENPVTSLDVSKNTALIGLQCSDCKLTSLDVTANTALTLLKSNDNQLTSLDVSKNTALETLECYNNKLTSLDVSNNKELETLYCRWNQLTSLDVSKNTALVVLYLDYNKLTNLDVSKNTALKYLVTQDNLLTSLDVSKNTALEELSCGSNQLTSLDVSNNTALTLLGCSINQLTSLDITKNTSLKYLNCYSNQLTSLDVSNNTALESLSAESNQLTSLDVSANTALTRLDCFYNQLTSLNMRNGVNLELYAFNATNNPNLTCIETLDPAHATTNLAYIDAGVTFAVICGGTDLTTWHVATTGSDGSGSGTETSPLATIQTGINATTTGDTVSVAAGTYVENITFSGKNIVVMGEDRETTIIDGNQSGSVVTFKNGEDSTAVLSRFKIVNGDGSINSSDYITGGGILCDNNSSPTLENLIVANNSARDGGGGIACVKSSNPKIKNSIISNNSTEKNSASYGGGGIFIYTESSPTINNVVIAFNSSGVAIYPEKSNVTLTNVTLAYNSIPAIRSWTGNTITLTNCILWDELSSNPIVHPDVNTSDDIPVKISYSLIRDGYNGTNNISKDPKFMKIITTGDEESDYHLKDWSPAIGAGTITGAPTTDIEGNPRPNPAGSNPDMGAFENKWGTPQNAPPVLTALSDVSVNEDESYSDTLRATDEEGDAITYSAASDTSAVTASITDSILTLTPNANWNGVANIKAYASDGTLKDSTTFTLSVTAVNDAPVIAAVSNDTTDEETEKAIKLSGSDIEGDALTYTASSDTSAVAITISTDTLKLTPALNYTGTSVITVIVSDNALTDTTKFDFKVINVNDAPVITAVANDTTSEDSDGKVLKLSASDIEGDALTYSAVSDTTGLTVTISNDTLRLKPVADYFGTSSVKLFVSDGQLKDSTAFSFTVLNVQDAPYAFDWLSTASDSINITESNLADTYELKWSESKDVDGETIDYLLYVKIGVLQPEEIYDTTSTSVPITYQEFLDNVFEPFPMLPRVSVQFTMEATDGIDTVKITGDNRVLFVNRYEFLSTEGEGIPTEFALHENYPNPFNPTTTLRFDLPEVSDITLTIYNMLGQRVKTFNMQSTPAGYHSITWDATNDLNQQVGAGVYLYQLQTKDFVKTRKMVLLK